MKLFLDPQIFYSQKYGGISRLFAELWNECITIAGIEVVCPLFYCENLHLRELKLQPKNLEFLFDKNYPGKKIFNALLKRVNRLSTFYFLKKKNYDVFVCTYYNPYFLGKTGKVPVVLTVFDMIHEIFPEYFPNEQHVRQHKKMLIEQCTKIISISSSTKKDILRFHPAIPASKISVIHLSQSLNFNSVSSTPPVWLPEKYILFVGKRDGYKQFNLLLDAMIPVFETDADINLVCAGGGTFTATEIKRIKKAKLSERILQKNFFDNELRAIYQGAEAFVFPSEYEGFGIPALEAMACGCPVILSETSSLPEIGGEAALYFKPNDVNELTACIRKILNDKGLKKLLTEKGIQQASKFSWKKMTNEFLTVLKETINH